MNRSKEERKRLYKERSMLGRKKDLHDVTKEEEWAPICFGRHDVFYEKNRWNENSCLFCDREGYCIDKTAKNEDK